MHVGVFSVIVLLGAILASGCTGTEIAPADSAATAPQDGDPIAALYAAPADVAFITVGDIRADIVVPTGGQPAAAFFGYSYEAELVTPFVDPLDGHTLPPAHAAGPDILSLLALDASDAVAPPVDLDAFFTAAPALRPAASTASADDEWERGPETQQPLVGWEAPPLDAK